MTLYKAANCKAKVFMYGHRAVFISDGQKRLQCVFCGTVNGDRDCKISRAKMHYGACKPGKPPMSQEEYDVAFDQFKAQYTTAARLFRLDEVDDVLKLSYMTAKIVAKYGLSYSVGSKIAQELFDAQATIRFKVSAEENEKYRVRLDDCTLKRRVDVMAADVLEQIVQNVINSSIGYAIQLDGSTDVAGQQQLICHVRHFKDEKFVDDILFVKVIDDGRAETIWMALKTFIESNHIPWDTLVGICTDGCPSMIGEHNGLVARVKEEAPAVIAVHCTLHRHSLVAKAGTNQFSDLMQQMSSVVCKIRKSSTYRAQFQQICDLFEASKDHLVYLNQVRWLSGGLMVIRFHELFTEINAFCVEMNLTQFDSLFSIENKHRVAYLADILGYINVVCCTMQKASTTIVDASASIKGFRASLLDFKAHVLAGDYTDFPLLLSEGLPSADLKDEIIDHLDNLVQATDRQFPDGPEAQGHALVRTPFTCAVDSVPQNLRLELNILRNQPGEAEAFANAAGKVEYWSSKLGSCKELALYCLRVLLPYGTSYLCEQRFSGMKFLKNQYRNRLHLEAPLRLYASTTQPRIDKLCKKKR